MRFSGVKFSLLKCTYREIMESHLQKKFVLSEKIIDFGTGMDPGFFIFVLMFNFQILKK